MGRRLSHRLPCSGGSSRNAWVDASDSGGLLRNLAELVGLTVNTDLGFHSWAYTVGGTEWQLQDGPNMRLNGRGVNSAVVAALQRVSRLCP